MQNSVQYYIMQILHYLKYYLFYDNISKLDTLQMSD